MVHSLRHVALFLGVVASPTLALAAPPVGFDAQVEALRKDVGTPGLAIAIVENGKTTESRGFGVRKLGSPALVDGDTLFANGSTGKAFTTAALGILVDQGKIKWDDRVIDHMPWFAMYDPWVTREMTIRDLLVHRSGLGLGEGDLLFVPRTSRTRRESVKQLRYLKPATSFRSAYAYDNVLYMAAGQLIEEVTGQSWEQFVAQHVLKPAGMLHSTTDEPKRFATADRAWPHARLDGPMRGMGTQVVLDETDELGRNGAPAGGMTVSANDMARWMLIQLAHGKLPEGNGRLFSEAVSNELWKPVVVTGSGRLPGKFAGEEPGLSGYALGWSVTDYRGTRLVMHDGAVFGFGATVVLIPSRNVGFTILNNSEDGEIVKGLCYELIDHYLGLPTQDWPAVYRAIKKERQVRGSQMLSTTSAAAAAAPVGPSLPLARYAGDFSDAWYGPMTLRDQGGKLRIDFKQTPRMTGTLEHFQYDSFRVRWDDKQIEPAYVTFGLDAQGKVERITMRAVSPNADFSWDYQDLLFTPAPAAK